MSWDGNIFTWPSFLSKRGEGSPSSGSSAEDAPSENSKLSLTPSQDSVEGEDLDDWELRLSDSSDESPEDASQDSLSDQVPSDQSLSISPNDATPPKNSPDSSPESGSSQEQSSIESQDGGDWSQDENYNRQSQERSYDVESDNQEFRWQKIGDYDEQENIGEDSGYDVQEPDERFDGDGRARSVHQRSSSKRRPSSERTFVDKKKRRSREKRRSSSGKDGFKVEFQNQLWGKSPPKKRKTSERKQTTKNKHSDATPRKKKRKSSENEFDVRHNTSDQPNADSASFEEEFSRDERIGTKRKERMKSSPRRQSFLDDGEVEEELPDELPLDLEELERLYEEGEEFVMPLKRKKRRYTAERLREINENWDRMYAVDDSPKSPEGLPEQLPDSAALNVKFALEQCLADIERTIKTRIPRALDMIQSKERRRKFSEDVGKDLTAIYNAVESKAVTHIQKLKENSARLAELDMIPMPIESMKSTLDELRTTASDVVASIERLRSNKELSKAQRSLLESHLSIYQKVSEENNARNEQHEAELADLEQKCAQLEENIGEAKKIREEDKGTETVARNLQAALETKDALQKELESIRERISEHEDIISFPDRLKVEKLLKALREMAIALLSSRGLSTSIDFEAEPSELESFSGIPDTQQSIEVLEDLFRSLSRTSVSTQTILAMQHVKELQSDLDNPDEPQDSSAVEEQQVTDGKSQSSRGADASAALD